MFLMGFGAMCGNGGRFVRLTATSVGSDPLTAVVDFDGVRGGANLHQLPAQLVRDAVDVEVELNMVVDIDARLRPVAEFEGRWFSFSSNSRMAWLSSARLKNFRCRSAARIQRSATSTPASTLALSRGFLRRAGTTPTP